MVLLITLFSCTNESVDLVPVQLLKKIIDVSVDGSSSTTLLTYEGFKIVSIDKLDKSSEFYYTGDLITKIVESDKTNQHQNILEYSYTDGRLVKILSSDNYFLNYSHNADGSVSYDKWMKDSNNNDIKIFHGILYFQSGNLVKDHRFLDDVGKDILAENIVSFEYDSKNNALYQIQGFNKLLNYSKIISLNNETNRSNISSIKHIVENQVISSINTYKRKHQYDSLGYQVEIVSENTIFGQNDSNHLKSLLFYN